MAASSASIARSFIPGDRKFVIADFTPSTSYPNGGEPLTASLFGLANVEIAVPCGVFAATALHATYDKTNNKLKLYTAATGAAVADASDQSGNVVRLLVIGS